MHHNDKIFSAQEGLQLAHQPKLKKSTPNPNSYLVIEEELQKAWVQVYSQTMNLLL